MGLLLHTCATWEANVRCEQQAAAPGPHLLLQHSTLRQQLNLFAMRSAGHLQQVTLSLPPQVQQPFWEEGRLLGAEQTVSQ